MFLEFGMFVLKVWVFDIGCGSGVFSLLRFGLYIGVCRFCCVEYFFFRGGELYLLFFRSREIKKFWGYFLF